MDLKVSTVYYRLSIHVIAIGVAEVAKVAEAIRQRGKLH